VASLSLKKRSRPFVFTSLPLLWKIIYLVLEALADILFALYQVAIFCSSKLTCAKSTGKLGPDFKADVSSANRKVSRDVQFGKSLINMRNKVGPRRLP
jgi:hypothetical protein